jgi:hypothetical protein
VSIIRNRLGGSWRSGPVQWDNRIEPLRAALSRNIGGRGLIQVDRDNAQAVHYALRGGWHFNVARTGLVSGIPVKDHHSHPGDAMSYGAAILFPMGKLRDNSKGFKEPVEASYFKYGPQDVGAGFQIGPGSGMMGPLPEHGARLLPRG